MTIITSDWEIIGRVGVTLGSSELDSVPDWVKMAYSKKNVHHDGVVYHFTGNHYLYKVVESGQGGGYRTYYRKLKPLVLTRCLLVY